MAVKNVVFLAKGVWAPPLAKRTIPECPAPALASSMEAVNSSPGVSGMIL